MKEIIYFCIFINLLNGACDGWRAVPANEAMYALRSADAGVESDDVEVLPDHLLPRDTLHSTYKFGFCTSQATKRQFLRTTINMSFIDKEDSLTDYLYVIGDMSTQRYGLQCVVMKFYTARKFQFWKSRIPLYYCQGQLYVHMMNTVQRLALHEFYLFKKLHMAVDIRFEFYQPDYLYIHYLEKIQAIRQDHWKSKDGYVREYLFVVPVAQPNGITVSSVRWPVRALRDFSTCHDDFSLKPTDGVLKKNTFGWLGFVQYTHVTTGLPHHSKSPRVTLIQKQFVIGTATDLLHLPKNYKLGNVIFGEYEREEEDCGITKTQLKLGGRCPDAYLETPLLDITPHPEYSRFGVGNSLALVKLLRPIKSRYMMPICMPSITERTKKKKNKYVFMVDYLSNVPRDFNSERMGKKTLKLYTHKDCRKHRLKSRLGSEGVTHVLCSSGCGVRPGAPILSHNSEGSFELIGVAAGGAPCAKRGMRRRLIKEPPLYIDVYPYITWIMNVITAHELPLPYPLNFRRAEGGTSIGLHKEFLRRRRLQKAGWRARTYVSGNFCFKNMKKQRKGAFFYSEKFEVNANPPAKLTIKMKISAGLECTIVCARLLLPNRLIEPVIDGVGGYNISVSFSSEWFPYTFYYTLGLTGRNTSERDFYHWLPERSKGYW